MWTGYPPVAPPHRFAMYAICGLMVVFTACQGPGSTARVLKLGLVAPFEGYQRDLGYRLLPAVKLAVDDFNRQQIAAHSDLRLLLVAMDDSADPAMTTRRVQQIAADPDMLAVLAGTEAATAQAAQAALPAGQLPLLLLSAPNLGAPSSAGTASLAPPLVARAQAALVYARQRLDISRPVIVGKDAQVIEAWREAAQAERLDATLVGEIGAPDVRLATVFLLAADGADAIFLLQQIRQAGLSQPVLDLGGLDTPKLGLLLGSGQGSVFAALPFCPAGGSCWQAGLDQQSPTRPAWEQAYQGAAHQPLSGAAALAYLSAAYLLQHLSPAQANRVALLQALQSDPPGTLPPVLVALPAPSTFRVSAAWRVELHA